MKIVRYLEAGTPAWGCVSSESIFRLDGDPFHKPQQGSLVGPLRSATLLAPCQPRKIVAVGINYPGATGLTETMTEPLVFLKAGTSACGPNDDIVSPFPNTPVWGE